MFYLCLVSRNSCWKYVEIGGVDTSVPGISGGSPSQVVSCIPSGKKVTFVVRLNRQGEYSLSVFNLKGRQVWSSNAGNGRAGLVTVTWDCRELLFSKKVHVVRLKHNNRQSVKKFTITY